MNLLKKVTQKTVIFESDKIKQTLVLRDKNDKITKAGRLAIENHTLRVEFDFANVTDDEILDFLTSTTSALKMFQNNVLKHWNEAQILAECKKGVYKLSVRKMLDERESKTMSDEEKRLRLFKKELEKGKTKDQLRKEIEEMFKNL